MALQPVEQQLWHPLKIPLALVLVFCVFADLVRENVVLTDSENVEVLHQPPNVAARIVEGYGTASLRFRICLDEFIGTPECSFAILGDNPEHFPRPLGVKHNSELGRRSA